ncbi:hypothetical protein QBC40DRAFT_312747 [Triangularia verruculosa]|uniref:Uncharacterized protein n=1 Tax=Triangularia verruculosa TaxID=2587418 RepID=A0AAN6XA16_9PEZI|nr:hypothetical protein QBC40DRAFT_312747 [Triangularia verruculosa]
MLFVAMRCGNIVLLASFLAAAHAARPCPASPSPISWQISEWTYDAPDRSMPGRAGTDSVIGLYLSTGGTTYSCFGMWPEEWKGFNKDKSALLWGTCVNIFGRPIDDTVSFAMDWERRILFASHTFACDNQEVSGLATASLVLPTSCDNTGSGGSPTRCLTTSRQINLNTTQQPRGQNPCSSVPASEKYLESWEIREQTKLYQSTPETEGNLFVAVNTATNETFTCASGGRTDDDLAVRGTCAPLGPSGGSTIASFSFDIDRKLLTMRQTWTCGSAVSTVEALGAATVPAPCFEDDVPICESSRFWVGGSKA